MVELRRIEAAEDIANNMAQSRNVVYLPQVPHFIFRLIVIKIERILILGESEFWGKFHNEKGQYDPDFSLLDTFLCFVLLYPPPIGILRAVDSIS